MSSRAKRILVVDPDRKSRRILEVSLRKAGFEVVGVESAQETLEAFAEAPVDLVISETQLADQSGFELCRRIKLRPDSHGLPFIFLSASSDVADKLKGFELGVEDYIQKPVYVREIATRIDVLLQRREQSQLLEDEAYTVRGKLSTYPLIDVLQTIEDGQKTGILRLERDGRKASLFFSSGQPLDASSGARFGEEAVYQMFRWEEADLTLKYLPNLRRPKRIAGSLSDLLLEALQRLEDYDSLVGHLPNVDAVYCVNYQELAGRVDGMPDPVREVLHLLDGRRSISDVVDDSRLSGVACLQVIERLLADGVLDETPPLDDDEREVMSSLSSADDLLGDWLDSGRPRESEIQRRKREEEERRLATELERLRSQQREADARLKTAELEREHAAAAAIELQEREAALRKHITGEKVAARTADFPFPAPQTDPRFRSRDSSTVGSHQPATRQGRPQTTPKRSESVSELRRALDAERERLAEAKRSAEVERSRTHSRLAIQKDQSSLSRKSRELAAERDRLQAALDSEREKLDSERRRLAEIERERKDKQDARQAELSRELERVEREKAAEEKARLAEQEELRKAEAKRLEAEAQRRAAEEKRRAQAEANRLAEQKLRDELEQARRQRTEIERELTAQRLAAQKLEAQLSSEREAVSEPEAAENRVLAVEAARRRLQAAADRAEARRPESEEVAAPASAPVPVGPPSIPEAAKTARRSPIEALVSEPKQPALEVDADSSRPESLEIAINTGDLEQAEAEFGQSGEDDFFEKEADALFDDLFESEPRRRGGLIFLGVALILAAFVVTYLIVSGGNGGNEAGEPAAAEPAGLSEEEIALLAEANSEASAALGEVRDQTEIELPPIHASSTATSQANALIDDVQADLTPVPEVAEVPVEEPALAEVAEPAVDVTPPQREEPAAEAEEQTDPDPPSEREEVLARRARAEPEEDAEPEEEADRLNTDRAMRRARELMGDDEYGEAAAQLRQVVEAEPSNRRAHRLLGEALMEIEEFEDAVDHLERASRSRRPDEETLLSLGSAYLELGDTTTAADTFRRYIELYPDGEKVEEVRPFAER